jgi:hypothetical protein
MGDSVVVILSMKFKSYSQNFEDVMLWRALGHVENGFYIDVGSYDPVEHSVTKAFYDRGWSGINIEPVSSRLAKFKVQRPDDINLELLISDEDRSIEFYEMKNGGLSTADPFYANLHQLNGFKFVRTQKKSRTS